MTEKTAPTLSAGSILAHYEIRSVLGAGGMGTVYLAHDTALDRPVAVKVLRDEVAGDPELVDRFVREARAAARVSHPNLTHVYFVGTSGDAGTSGDRPFFALEYCPGDTLEALVKREGPLTLVRGLDVLAQAARGLAAAHGAGVVHRDVKPSNLMILPDGTVKVTDFGLAKSLQGDVQATSGRIMGTPTYMSPEQVRGKEVDARTDIYLLGLTGYFLFAGKPAYASDQMGEVIHDQMSTPLPDLTVARPDLPPAVGEFLARMCSKDPAQRPATMEEVGRMAETLRPRPLNIAPLVARGVAYMVDLIIIGFASLACMGLDKVILGGRMPGLVLSVVGSAVVVVFALLPEIRWGTTAGKALLNIGVVRLDGTHPRTGALVARFLLRFPLVFAISTSRNPNIVDAVGVAVQGVAIAVGVLWYFFAQGRTLSDFLTRTRVVYRFGRTGTPPGR